MERAAFDLVACTENVDGDVTTASLRSRVVVQQTESNCVGALVIDHAALALLYRHDSLKQETSYVVHLRPLSASDPRDDDRVAKRNVQSETGTASGIVVEHGSDSDDTQNGELGAMLEDARERIRALETENSALNASHDAQLRRSDVSSSRRRSRRRSRSQSSTSEDDSGHHSLASKAAAFGVGALAGGALAAYWDDDSSSSEEEERRHPRRNTRARRSSPEIGHPFAETDGTSAPQAPFRNFERRHRDRNDSEWNVPSFAPYAAAFGTGALAGRAMSNWGGEGRQAPHEYARTFAPHARSFGGIGAGEHIGASRIEETQAERPWGVQSVAPYAGALGAGALAGSATRNWGGVGRRAPRQFAHSSAPFDGSAALERSLGGTNDADRMRALQAQWMQAGRRNWDGVHRQLPREFAAIEAADRMRAFQAQGMQADRPLQAPSFAPYAAALGAAALAARPMRNWDDVDRHLPREFVHTSPHVGAIPPHTAALGAGALAGTAMRNWRTQGRQVAHAFAHPSARARSLGGSNAGDHMHARGHLHHHPIRPLHSLPNTTPSFAPYASAFGAGVLGTAAIGGLSRRLLPPPPFVHNSARSYDDIDAHERHQQEMRARRLWRAPVSPRTPDPLPHDTTRWNTMRSLAPSCAFDDIEAYEHMRMLRARQAHAPYAAALGAAPLVRDAHPHMRRETPPGMSRALPNERDDALASAHQRVHAQDEQLEELWERSTHAERLVGSREMELAALRRTALLSAAAGAAQMEQMRQERAALIDRVQHADAERMETQGDNHRQMLGVERQRAQASQIWQLEHERAALVERAQYADTNAQRVGRVAETQVRQLDALRQRTEHTARATAARAADERDFLLRRVEDAEQFAAECSRRDQHSMSRLRELEVEHEQLLQRTERLGDELRTGFERELSETKTQLLAQHDAIRQELVDARSVLEEERLRAQTAVQIAAEDSERWQRQQTEQRERDEELREQLSEWKQRAQRLESVANENSELLMVERRDAEDRVQRHSENLAAEVAKWKQRAQQLQMEQRDDDERIEHLITQRVAQRVEEHLAHTAAQRAAQEERTLAINLERAEQVAAQQLAAHALAASRQRVELLRRAELETAARLDSERQQFSTRMDREREQWHQQMAQVVDDRAQQLTDERTEQLALECAELRHRAEFSEQQLAAIRDTPETDSTARTPDRAAEPLDRIRNLDTERDELILRVRQLTDELQEQARNFTAERMDLVQRVENATATLHELSERAEQAEQRLENSIRENERERTELLRHADERDSHVARVEFDLSSMRQHSDGLTQRSSQLHDRARNFAAERAELVQRAEHNSAKLREFAQRAEQAEQRLENATGDIEKQRVELLRHSEERDSHAARLEADFNLMRQQKEEQTQRSEHIGEELIEQTRKFADERTELMLRTEHTAAKLHDFAERAEQAEQRLENAVRENERERTEVLRHSAERDSHVARLEADLNSMRQHSEKLTQRSVQLGEELHDQARKFSDERTELVQRVEHTSAKLHDFAERAEQAEQRLENAVRENERERTEVLRHSAERDSHVARLEADLNSMRQRSGELTQRSEQLGEELKEQTHRFADERTELMSRVEHASAKLHELTQRTEQAEQRFRSAESENERERAQLLKHAEERNSHLLRLQADLSSMHEQSAELTQRTEQLHENLHDQAQSFAEERKELLHRNEQAAAKLHELTERAEQAEQGLEKAVTERERERTELLGIAYERQLSVTRLEAELASIRKRDDERSMLLDRADNLKAEVVVARERLRQHNFERVEFEHKLAKVIRRARSAEKDSARFAEHLSGQVVDAQQRVEELLQRAELAEQNAVQLADEVATAKVAAAVRERSLNLPEEGATRHTEEPSAQVTGAQGQVDRLNDKLGELLHRAELADLHANERSNQMAAGVEAVQQYKQQFAAEREALLLRAQRAEQLISEITNAQEEEDRHYAERGLGPERVEQLSAEIDTLTERIQVDEVEHSALLERAKQAEDRVQQLEAEHSDLLERAEQADKRITMLTGEHEAEMDVTRHRLECEIRDYRARFELAEVAAHKAEERIREMMEEQAALHQQREADRIELQNEAAAILEQHDDELGELLRGEMNDGHREEMLRRTIQRLSKERDDWHQRYDRTEQLAVERVAQLASEVVAMHEHVHDNDEEREELRRIATQVDRLGAERDEWRTRAEEAAIREAEDAEIAERVEALAEKLADEVSACLDLDQETDEVIAAQPALGIDFEQGTAQELLAQLRNANMRAQERCASIQALCDASRAAN